MTRAPDDPRESPQDDDNLATVSDPESAAQADGANTGMRPDQAKPSERDGTADEH